MSDEVHPALRKSLAIAATLVAAGGIVCAVALLRREPSGDNGLGGSFRYDLTALREVDPSLIIADETGGFPAGVKQPTALAVGPGNAIYVGGAGEIAVFVPPGRKHDVLKVNGQVTALGLAEDGLRIYAAMRDRVAILDGAGVAVGALAGLNSNSVFTAVAPVGKAVFVADAGNRVVLRYGADNTIDLRFGEKAGEYSEGFVIPSPYFPLVKGLDDTLWVVDPGRHRFVNFTLDGRIRSRWEKVGMTIEGFCGCCNPTHFAIREDGSFVTAEKGLVRVKVHAPDGSLVGVVAAPEKFGADTRGLALAVDAEGRILVLDPERAAVRTFTVRAGDQSGKREAVR